MKRITFLFAILIIISLKISAQTSTVITWNADGTVASELPNYNASDITVINATGLLPTVSGFPTSDFGTAYLTFTITTDQAQEATAQILISSVGTGGPTNYRATYNIGSGNVNAGTGTLPGTITINPPLPNFTGTITYRIYPYGGSGGSLTLGSSSALPIELTSFEPKRVGNTVVITWTTATETNNAYMVVERSRDGVHFAEIDRRKAYGNGNSRVPQTYTSTDDNPLPGRSYYRLHQYDKDGKDAYHVIKSVFFGESKAGIQVFPTLVSDQLNIAWEKETSTDGEVFVSNVAGQLLLRKAIGVGTQQETIELPTLPAGTYFVTVQTTRSLQTARFVKQ